MRLLITGADRPLAQLLASRLGRLHSLRLAACALPKRTEGAQWLDVDLREPDQVAPLVSDMDAILHLAEYDPGDLGETSGAKLEQERLDHAARGTYVLLQQALKAKVERLILASSLQVMAAYPTTYVIDETWRPRPLPTVESLAPFLAEIVCRECAREAMIRIVCLRFGVLNDPDGTSEEHAVAAIEAALVLQFRRPGYYWHLFNVSASRCVLSRATEHTLGLGEHKRQA